MGGRVSRIAGPQARGWVPTHTEINQNKKGKLTNKKFLTKEQEFWNRQK